MKLARLALVLLIVLLAAGCGEDEATTTETTTATETVTTPVESAQISVYFVREGKVWPVAREIGDVLFEPLALQALLRGPTTSEQDDLELETAIPAGLELGRVSVENGVATVELEGAGADALSDEALAQIVYTESAYANVDSVSVGGRSYTRADFEAQTPAILVESPLPFEKVTSPVHAIGTANTFEATFQYELTDTDGKIVDQNFVTATSGTGTRGTFDFTTDEFTVPFDGMGALIVYELSAEDGKTRLHLVEIPLAMTKS